MRRDVIAAVRNAVAFCYHGSLGLLYTRLDLRTARRGRTITLGS